MDTKELESILEGGRETESVEFKSPCEWDDSIIKDILAMANLRNGGMIIIGVKEENNQYVKVGISEEQKESYKIDIIKDKVGEYADPYVDFTIKFVKDRENRTYVVIKVFPFEEQPVICKKDSTYTKRGVVYYRTKNRRPESAPVSDSNHMREIIELAVEKKLKKEIEKLKYLNVLIEENNDEKKFVEELKGL